jgi:hypothetical protein
MSQNPGGGAFIQPVLLRASLNDYTVNEENTFRNGPWGIVFRRRGAIITEACALWQSKISHMAQIG